MLTEKNTKFAQSMTSRIEVILLCISPASIFTFQFHFFAKTSPLHSLPAVTTKPAPTCQDRQCYIPIQITIMKNCHKEVKQITWQSFRMARSWSCTLLQIIEPWIEQDSPIVTWFITTELTTCMHKSKSKENLVVLTLLNTTLQVSVADQSSRFGDHSVTDKSKDQKVTSC